MDLKNIAAFFIVAISTVITLIYGQDLLIPFVFALLLWFLIRKIRAGVDRINVIKQRFPGWLKNLITSIIILGIIGGFSQMLSSNISSLSESYETYESNADFIIDQIDDTFNIDIKQTAVEHAGDVDFEMILGSIFTSITDIFSNAFAILFYALFFFLEEVSFKKKIRAIYTNDEKHNEISSLLFKIESSMTRYIGLKTQASLIMATMGYVALWIIGIDSPIFWAFLLFVSYFIPTVGMLVGIGLPAIFSLLQFGEFVPAISVIVSLVSVQLVSENIIEPKIVGRSLNLSSLATVISLSFWGAIWGITGMILSVPITVAIVIVFSKFDKTKAIAILLSEKGKVN